jgi:hypothetical protein
MVRTRLSPNNAPKGCRPVSLSGDEMGEHYTRNTTEVTAWCKQCQRMTQHRVDGGRLGPCLEHETPVKPKPERTKQEDLFE